jgi:purine-binding chemotaxis protein CheW
MKQYATFRLDNHLFGIDVLLVREINQYMIITPVPLAAQSIRGLINLRGQIVTVVDLGVLIGLEPRAITKESHSMVLKTQDDLSSLRVRFGNQDLTGPMDTVGLLVDGVGDVVDVDLNEMEPPPANVGDIDGQFLAGIIKLESELLVLLNIGKALESLQLSTAQ